MSDILGFNNLTKALSFNIYDFAVALSNEERLSYIRYIDERYSAKQIESMLIRIAEIMEANVLSVSSRDFEPSGASVVLLMSDMKGEDHAKLMLQSTVNVHLDKSHICAHTYPDSWDPEGICSFRVDIDIATCGTISPLHALDFMLTSFESDVVIADYVVRGHTRNLQKQKIYMDHNISSISEFIAPSILQQYSTLDDNNPGSLTFQTKLCRKNLDDHNYFRNPKQLSADVMKQKMALIREEMDAIFHSRS